MSWAPKWTLGPTSFLSELVVSRLNPRFSREKQQKIILVDESKNVRIVSERPNLRFQLNNNRRKFKMTTNLKAEQEAILARLEAMGFPADNATGTRHYIPKAGERNSELKAISVNEQRALENQKYYLTQAKKSGKPWFHHPKNKEQYSEFVLVSPEMARQLLEWNKNPRKRVMQTVIDRYCTDMRNGEWNDNSSAIAIDYNGHMHNGQHRINAIIQLGKPQRLWFTFQTLTSAREDEDTGAPRKPAVQIELKLNNRIGNKLPAICRAAMRGVNGTTQRISSAQLAEFAELYGAQIEWLAKLCPTYRSDILGAFLKAVLWYGPDRMEPFLKRFGGVLFDSKEDPARLLHSVAKGIRGPRTRVSLYKKALSAIHHYVNNNKVTKLMERDEDIFEWESGWSVPKH